MKKFLLCVILFAVAIIVGIFAPWEKLYTITSKLSLSKKSFSSLKVYSLNGNMQIYVGGEAKGTVRADEVYSEIFPIEPGEHLVKLVRETDAKGFYSDFEKVLKFEEGVDTVISWEIGPTEDSSSGWILYARKVPMSEGTALLDLQCVPKGCDIEINGETGWSCPVSDLGLSLENQHTLKVSGQGCQSLEFQILPEDHEERMKLEGYQLFLEVNLYQMPI